MAANHPRRYHTRSDIRDVEISDNRETELREAFETIEYGENIQQFLPATFEVDGNVRGDGVVISSRLDRERVFDPVSSFAHGGDISETTRCASATVTDPATDSRIRADVSKSKVLISPRSETLPFETFRDYVLFLENVLDVSLEPVLPPNNSS